MVDYTQTGGGAACVYGAGIEYGMHERGLRSAITRARGYSGGALNQATGAAGKADQLLTLYKRIIPGLIDKRTCMKRLIGLDRDKPIVHLDVVHSAIDDVLKGVMLEANPYPLHVLVAQKGGGTRSLDARLYGAPALKATCCISAAIPIEGIEYTDPGFYHSFAFDTWESQPSTEPEIIVINTGKPSRTGTFEAAAFFRAQFGKEAYATYKHLVIEERAALRRVYEQGKPVLRLRPKTPIAFSTTDESLLDQAFEEGRAAAARVERFLNESSAVKAA